MSELTAQPGVIGFVATPPLWAEPRAHFPAELPVSYDAAGQVASRFGDQSWDLTSMSTDGSTRLTLHFYSNDPIAASRLDLLIREQQKALIWLHMDAGKTRSPRAIYLANLAITAWCRLAAKRGVDLFSLLSNPEWVTDGASHLNVNYLDSTSSVLRTMWRHRKELGSVIDLQVEKLRQILNEEARSRRESQQTPLIPSRVYCAILAALDDRLTVIERELDLLLDAYEKDRAVSREATRFATPKQHWENRAKALADVAANMRTLGYDPIQNKRLDSFIAGRLGEHQIVLMLAVAAYTGVRAGEVSILRLEGSLEPFQHLGSTHFEIHGQISSDYELRGETHKLNKGVKRSTTWITSHQGARAVRLAQRIAQAVVRVNDLPAKAGQQALLFPALTNPYKRISDSNRDAYLKRIRATICPVIEQSDIEELDRLELSRGWARDDILVGLRWPLAFHQLRRSLAVYAHRSGMVSLPALKAQLQHITQEMTLYYSAGFSRAVNLVFDKTHFSHEWEAAKAESSYFAYAFAVLFSDEDLLGQGVTRMADVVESRSREDTLRLFQAGKVAFRETPLGGCISADECKTHPLEPIPFDCLESNCVNMVVFERRLEHIIKSQETTVTSLFKDAAGSVEYRLEARHLEVLLKARARLKKGAA